MSTKTPESVWDYPRPPAVDPSSERVLVRHNGVTICDTTRAIRVLETSHPPTYYIPLEDFAPDILEPVAGSTVCEFKGVAHYADVVADDQRIPRAVWWYPEPNPRFESLRGHAALYPGLFDEVSVDGESVQAQEGDFYGGWITSRVTGPFKGAPGTWGW